MANKAVDLAARVSARPSAQAQISGLGSNLGQPVWLIELYGPLVKIARVISSALFDADLQFFALLCGASSWGEDIEVEFGKTSELLQSGVGKIVTYKGSVEAALGEDNKVATVQFLGKIAMATKIERRRRDFQIYSGKKKEKARQQMNILEPKGTLIFDISNASPIEKTSS
ncbi:Hypothetical predicted protein [Olea europaea subsp. europaea]|uniref:Uncharacterized protein n=1 Tax=Olea europaea subsp. europaea TaxID=158383 RepID=A0A8S0S2C7_OLEEU|nr:Hypothetical predicted protein [Olea europaea subsp. europaea]